MFDFEKLEVYQLLRNTNVELLRYLEASGINDKYLEDQLKRAAFSITLNLAEDVGRTTKPDKRRFVTMVRSSLFETVSLVQILRDLDKMESELYKCLYDNYTSISKMLLGLYRGYGEYKK